MSTLALIIAACAAGLAGAAAGYLTARHRIAGLNKDLAAATGRDRLTGIPNRTQLTARLRELNAGRHNAVLAIINIDGFADINRFGYRIADQLLVLLACRIRAHARQRGGEVFRLRADEFAAVWPAEAGQAQLLTRELLDELAQPTELQVADRPVIVHLTASAGVTTLTPTGGGDPARRPLTEANAALQHAKKSRHGSIIGWHTGLPVLPRHRRSPHHRRSSTNEAYLTYVSGFDSPTIALLDVAARAGIAVAYLDRAAIEATRGQALTDDQWSRITPQLDWYDEDVSGGDTNLAFLEQVFHKAGVPFDPDGDSGTAAPGQPDR